MAVYLVAQVNVQDWDRFKNYQGGVLKSLAATGEGRVIAAGKATKLEGEEPRDLTVLFEFPSEEAATRWYHSEDYQNIIPIREESAPGANFTMLAGL